MTLNTPSGVTGFVLVVDDEDDARLMTSELLAARGYAVEAVRSGFEALEFIQRTPPDLVLLDVLMEGMDGFETLRRIRALNITPYIPVVLLTALDTRHRDFGIDSGADDYITKPWSIDDLLARVKVGLRLRRLQTDLHREKERFRSVVENAFDPWAEISSDGSLTPLNHRCREFFHIESAVSLPDLISEDHAEELAAFLSDAAASGRASADLLLKDGVRTVRISAAPIASGDGNGSVLQCCIRDITTEVQQLDELNRQKELLEEQISELHDQVADRFDFSGMLSRNSRIDRKSVV